MVHFAGFALTGNADKSSQSFPYTKELLDRTGGQARMDFNRLLAERINADSFQNLTITSDLGDAKKGDALALAFGLTWENISTERFEDFTKIAVNLQAEAILFDFTTKQIVATYPFGVEYIDSVKGDPDHNRILSDVATLYDDPSGGLFSAFVDTLHRIKPKGGFGGRIQVVSVGVAQPASDVLSANHIDGTYASDLLVNGLERYISFNDDIPILPHASDQIIGGVMVARFQNGDIYNFTIPNADYQIRLNLENLRKIEVSRTASQTATAYAAYLAVQIKQPLSGTEYLDASIKYPIVKVLALSGTPDDSASFQESLLAISDQLAQQFSHPSNDWIKKWVVRQGQTDQMSKMPSLLDHCR